MSAQNDLQDLLARLRQHLYPETIPVLASYWLKTLLAADHSRAWWRELNAVLKQALRLEPLDASARNVLTEVRCWIEESGVLARQTSEAQPSPLQPYRPNLQPEWLAPYVARLLNKWLSTEVANLLVENSDCGVPGLALGKALERLLARERLSPATLKMLLQPELLSPRFVYPADVEMLRDVVCCLLGRTSAPSPPVLPATLLGVPHASPLPADFGDTVRRAVHVTSYGREEIHVPIGAEQALRILHAAPMHLASIIVTMDGRWWESEKLQSGEQHAIVYKPGGRLRIDSSAEHARLMVPWPETRLHWSGEVHIEDSIELFGREWHMSSWETDGKRTWLHLEFTRVLPIAEIQPAADAALRRSHPAAVDIAWAALETALAEAFAQKSSEPIEQVRRPDFIPLGRALYALAESMNKYWPPKRQTLETQLKAVRYLQAEIAVEYGRVPWRILPEPVRAGFLRRRTSLDLINQVFDELPQELSPARVKTQPSQAA